MQTVKNSLDIQPPPVISGRLAPRLINKTIQELDQLLASGESDPFQLQNHGNWLSLLDAVDNLHRIRYTHGNLYRATLLGIKLCRSRLLVDPGDMYSQRELTRVRNRLASWLPCLEVTNVPG